jgi:hypothetical protein
MQGLTLRTRCSIACQAMLLLLSANALTDRQSTANRIA